MPRIDASLVSEAQFAETYERGSQPVLVRGLVDEWPAVATAMDLEKLLQSMAKIASRLVRMTMGTRST